MRYKNISEAEFICRPNRFIAYILHEGEEKICHVKNTGRCKELLLPGTRILVQRAESSLRKTPFDLISVYKGERLINMDSVAPNAVFGEFLRSGGLGFVPDKVKKECSHGNSRFDFYFEHDGISAFAEVKGVTLEDNGVVRFPDAPTERGIKHLRGLMDCVAEGYEAYAVFVVQMQNVRYFEPNRDTHPEFANTLKMAYNAGVKVLVYECKVDLDSLEISEAVELRL